ncbi:MAG: tetratricopeptide repeat protein, partial [Deltaproteobacteria bacterium]|nr:tetratricopeptide repeat protein [Deltaproteobacteria bacterium]
FYNSLQKFQEALEELGKAARLKPDAEEPNEILVDVLMGAGSFDKAENILKAILASNKGGASHAYKLGIALSRQGKHEEALQFFDQLLSQMPGDFMTLFEKAGTLEKMGKKEEALNLYQAILNSKVPDNQALAQTLGMIQEEARKRLGKQ